MSDWTADDCMELARKSIRHAQRADTRRRRLDHLQDAASMIDEARARVEEATDEAA